MVDDQSVRETVETTSEEETRAFGEVLAGGLEAGDLLLLEGDFGSGKTVLVQGLARGLDVCAPVTSPSFVLAREYSGRLPLLHVDLYRLESPDAEMVEAIWAALDDGAVVAVEWPALLPGRLKERAIVIRLTLLDEQRRAIEVVSPRRLAWQTLTGTSHAASH